MPKVSIVGAGLIGRAFAMVFARAGWDAALFDPVAGVAEAARAACHSGLVALAEHGLCEDPAGAHARLTVAGTLAEALDGAEHVQESGPERPEVKRELFAELDRLASRDAVLASSTSAIQCSLFTEALDGRHRCLVAHPVNPPHLVPVVELSGAPWTDPAALERARATFDAIGMAPVTVLKEIDGFILNRLQAALLSEAFRLVAEGYVSPQDLDRTVADGLGLRWSFMGPFQTIELNAPGGAPDYCTRYAPFFRRVAPELGGATAWTEETIAACLGAWGGPRSVEELEAKSRWRDDRLAALAAHKSAQKTVQR
ncbi:3-hydroxyacyl-CoA dehydrogenase [Acuticoccus sp.]|uniref:3-hydroxyacyl-CoA dehydrogenase n=1 Tax=Acuticoccus sp. TaxID=1904378 RepID=UPI003B51F7FF